MEWIGMECFYWKVFLNMIVMLLNVVYGQIKTLDQNN